MIATVVFRCISTERQNATRIIRRVFYSSRQYQGPRPHSERICRGIKGSSPTPRWLCAKPSHTIALRLRRRTPTSSRFFASQSHPHKKQRGHHDEALADRCGTRCHCVRDPRRGRPQPPRSALAPAAASVPRADHPTFATFTITHHAAPSRTIRHSCSFIRSSSPTRTSWCVAWGARFRLCAS